MGWNEENCVRAESIIRAFAEDEKEMEDESVQRCGRGGGEAFARYCDQGISLEQ